MILTRTQLSSHLKDGLHYFGFSSVDGISKTFLKHSTECNLSGYARDGNLYLFLNFSDHPVGTPIPINQFPFDQVHQAWIMDVPNHKRDLFNIINSVLESDLVSKPLSIETLPQLLDENSPFHPSTFLRKANELIYEPSELTFPMNRWNLYSHTRHCQIHPQAISNSRPNKSIERLYQSLHNASQPTIKPISPIGSPIGSPILESIPQKIDIPNKLQDVPSMIYQAKDAEEESILTGDNHFEDDTLPQNNHNDEQRDAESILEKINNHKKKSTSQLKKLFL